MTDGQTIQTFRGADGLGHLRVDSPGERAVSAPIRDAIGLIRSICFDSDLEYDDTVPDQITISIPPGA